MDARRRNDDVVRSKPIVQPVVAAKNKKDNQGADWKRYFTPDRLKIFHTLLVIMFVFLIMSYIFNTKSNMIRVLLILSMSALLVCESMIIYSYKWV